MNFRQFLFYFAVILLSILQIHKTEALIETLSIDFDDRTTFHISSFAFAPESGHFHLSVSNFTAFIPKTAADSESNRNIDLPWRIAFVLIHSKNDEAIRINTKTSQLNEPEAICFHEQVTPADDNDISSIQLFNMSNRQHWAQNDFVKVGMEAGYWHLYFSNCELYSHVSFDAVLTQYNVIDGQTIFVSAGETSLPTCYFVIFGLFVAETAAWVFLMIKNRSEVKMVHYLMLACVIVKALSLLFLSLKYHSLKYLGIHDAFYTIYDLFAFLKGVLLVSVIVLLATGFSYIKAALTERDKNIMLVTLCIQSMANLALIVLDSEQEGTAGFTEWRDMFHWLDILSWLVLLIPILLSIRHMRETAARELGKEDDRIGKHLNRLKSFRTFYLIVICYVYFSRILVYLLNQTLPFESKWLASFLNEVASLTFYFTTGWLFKPQRQNVYLELNQEDIEELEDLKQVKQQQEV